MHRCARGETKDVAERTDLFGARCGKPFAFIKRAGARIRVDHVKAHAGEATGMGFVLDGRQQGRAHAAPARLSGYENTVHQKRIGCEITFENREYEPAPQAAKQAIDTAQIADPAARERTFGGFEASKAKQRASPIARDEGETRVEAGFEKGAGAMCRVHHRAELAPERLPVKTGDNRAFGVGKP